MYVCMHACMYATYVEHIHPNLCASEVEYAEVFVFGDHSHSKSGYIIGAGAGGCKHDLIDAACRLNGCHNLVVRCRKQLVESLFKEIP